MTKGLGSINPGVLCQIFVVSVFLFEPLVEGYKPVVIVHGILDSRHSLNSLADRIRWRHPGTNVTIIDRLHGWKSITPIWFQVNAFKKDLVPIMNENPDGVHLIGFSQGGLVARGLIQSISNHTVHNFISLSSPQAGQYGDDFLHIYFPNYVKATAYEFLYSEGGQLTSIGNYWRDPHHVPLFLNYSTFLARVDILVDTPNGTEYKENFLKLKKLVLIGGPDDGIICPWQSSHFGFYDENENVVDMKLREEYTNDTFGLRTLDLSGRMVTVTVPGIQHHNWHKNHSIIDHHILPYLD